MPGDKHEDLYSEVAKLVITCATTGCNLIITHTYTHTHTHIHTQVDKMRAQDAIYGPEEKKQIAQMLEGKVNHKVQ